MAFKFIRIENGEVKSVYDDALMRNIGITVFDQAFGMKFKSGTETGIDLVLIDDPSVGAEGEDGSWDGDRWVGGQKDIFNLGVGTLNIQDRKWHFWNLQELSEKPGAKRFWGKVTSGWNKNFYFRLNRQGDQMCIVDAETILDDNKRLFALNRKVSNNDEAEDWICIPEEYVKTYNLQPSGEWVLNGKYCGPDQEECKKIRYTLEKQKREYEKKRLKEIASKLTVRKETSTSKIIRK